MDRELERNDTWSGLLLRYTAPFKRILAQQAAQLRDLRLALPESICSTTYSALTRVPLVGRRPCRILYEAE